MQPKTILLLFLCASASLLFPSQQAWEAAGHNTEISGALLGKNACGFAAKQPTEDDAFSYAGIRAVSLVPQIGNATSDLSSPSLLWSWAADAPESAVFRLPGTTECPGGEMELFNRSSISFSEGSMSYRYGNGTAEAALAATGPNPVPLGLNSSWLDDGDFSQLYAQLTVRLSAKASAEYSFRRRELYKTCEYHENFTVCYCEEKYTSGKRKYGHAISDERNFSVEIGPVQEFWLNPPLQKRLAGDATGKVLFFARRMMGKITASVGGVEIASATPFEFEISNGSCGESIVKSVYSPSGENAKINRSNQTLFPHQLVEKNASYLPFYLEFSWGEAAGGKQLSLEYEDWFSNKVNFTRNFSVRRPEPFVSNSTESAFALRVGDDKTSPAAYPSQEKAGVVPDVAPLAALLAIPLALGAIGLLRWMRKIVP
jgi:hypothetical protein